jgi:hypothetical protein
VAPKGNAKLGSHVTQSAQPNDTKFHVGGEAEVHHWGVDCDASTEERSGSSQIKSLWDFQSESTIHNDMFAVAAVGVVAALDAVFVFGVVGPNVTVGAILFLPLATVAAVATRIHKAANTSVLTNGHVFHIGAHSNDNTTDLVTWNHGEGCLSPLLTDLMNIRVTDSSVLDLNDNIIVSHCSSGDGEGMEAAIGLRSDEGEEGR